MTHDKQNISSVHLIASLAPSVGGPAYTVPGLCRALALEGVQVCLITENDQDDFEQDNTAGVLHYRVSGRRAMINTLREHCAGNDFNIIHLHGLWLPFNHVAVNFAAGSGYPLVISSRGMLEPWAMGYKKFKKTIAWRLYQKKDLTRANLIHATSSQEAENIMRLGLDNPLTIIPNGVDLPERREKKTGCGKNRRALFLSRIHPKKGVLDLVEAWRRLSPESWELVIAGPDEGGHKREVEKLIAQNGVGESVFLVDPVKGEAKWDLYRSSDLFILPTRSENFGVVVAEALACEVPVITTRGAPWEELIDWQCGWWIPSGIEPLVDALTQAVSISDPEREAMGRRGRDLVKRNYSWSKVASKMKQAYRWLQGVPGNADILYGGD